MAGRSDLVLSEWPSVEHVTVSALACRWRSPQQCELWMCCRPQCTRHGACILISEHRTHLTPFRKHSLGPMNLKSLIVAVRKILHRRQAWERTQCSRSRPRSRTHHCKGVTCRGRLFRFSCRRSVPRCKKRQPDDALRAVTGMAKSGLTVPSGCLVATLRIAREAGHDSTLINWPSSF